MKRLTHRILLERFKLCIMLSSEVQLLELFAASCGEDASAVSEPETSAIRVVDGLRIRAVVDGLPDGKRSGRLSELASDKLSIRLSNFLSLVRYYFVLNILRFHAKLTKVAKSYKRPPKFSKFRSASGRALSVSGSQLREFPQSSAFADTGCPIDCLADCEFCARH